MHWMLTAEVEALRDSVTDNITLDERLRDADGRIKHDVLCAEDDSVDDMPRAGLDIRHERDGGAVRQNRCTIGLKDLDGDLSIEPVGGGNSEPDTGGRVDGGFCQGNLRVIGEDGDGVSGRDADRLGAYSSMIAGIEDVLQTYLELELQGNRSCAVVEEAQTSAQTVHVKDRVRNNRIEQSDRASGADVIDQILVVRRDLELAKTVVRHGDKRVVAPSAPRGRIRERLDRSDH